jgi:hypothetical protein
MATPTEQLQDAIRDCGRSRYALSRETGIGQDHLCRFLNGSKRLLMETIDVLFDALDLEIVVRPRRKRADTDA